MVGPARKLLVLDVNGLLIDTYYEGETRPDRPHDEKVHKFYVYKRPFCDKFIQFCLENFVVGVWSSALEHSVQSLVEYVFKESKEKLAFIWHQNHCTDTGFRHPDNKYKPLFLKELWRLWKKYKTNLPWVEGDYGPSNTLLIDDSAYKAINNPPHTAIFPKTYKATNLEDNYLDGELRLYLEALLVSADVQAYLQGHPIGEPSIALGDPQWVDILTSVKLKNERELFIPAHLVGMSVPVLVDPVHAGERWRRADNFVPMNDELLPHMHIDGPSRQFDNVWAHPDFGPDRHHHIYGGGFNPGFARGFPEGDSGLSWVPGRARGPPLGGIPVAHGTHPSDSGRMERGETFVNPFHQRFDPAWRHPDFDPHLRSHDENGSFDPSSLAVGFPGPGSDGGHHWPPGPMPNETPHLGEYSVDPGLFPDWRRKTPGHGQPANDSLIPPNYSMPQVGVDAQMQRVAYEDIHREHPDFLNSRFDSGNFSSSGLGGGFPDIWPPRPRHNDIPHLVSNIAVPELHRSSDWRRRAGNEILNHRAAENVEMVNVNLTSMNLSMPHGSGDTQFRRAAIDEHQLKRSELAPHMKYDIESGSHAPPRFGNGISDVDGGPYRSLQPKSDEALQLIGVSGPNAPHPGLSPDLQRRTGNKFANSFDPRFDDSAAGPLHSVNDDVIPSNLNMPLFGSDARLRQAELWGSRHEHSHLVSEVEREFDRGQFSPSTWGSDLKGRDAGPSKPHGHRSKETGHLVGSTGTDHDRSLEWAKRAGKKFGSSVDQSRQHKADETFRATSGTLLPENISDPHSRSDARTRIAAYDSDRSWERPDHVTHPKQDYVRDSFVPLGRANGISEFDAGSSWSLRPRSSEAGHGSLRKSRNADDSFQKRTVGKPSDYEYMSRGGDRMRDDYLVREGFNRKRTRDPEDVGRGWSVEHKDPVIGRSRDSNRVGGRTRKDAHHEDPGWSIEPMDFKRGLSTKFNRDLAREARDFGMDDHRAFQGDDGRNHLIQRRDRGRAREYEEPYFRDHVVSPRPNYRKEEIFRREESQGRVKNEGRDLQRAPNRDYHGNRDRHENSQRWGLGGERDYDRNFSHKYSVKDDWNLSGAGKRGILK